MESIKLDKMCYKRDKLAYLLVLGGLALNVFYFFTLYKSNSTFFFKYNVGISILYNLLFMLFVFLSAEEIKNYHRNFAIVLFSIGVAQIVRIFILPLNGLRQDAITNKNFIFIAIYLALSAALLISGAIISFIHSTKLKNYKASKGE